MKPEIFILIGIIIWVLVLVIVKPKVQRMNREEKEIFESAMRNIDNSK